MQKSINHSVAVLFFIICTFYSLVTFASTTTFHHHMEIQLSPDTSEIRVKDRIQIPDSVRNGKEPVQLEFFLHAGLSITDVEGAAIQVEEKEITLKSRSISIRQYIVTVPPDQQAFTLQFSGKIHHPVQGPGQEYARSFGSTPGVISPEGVFLANSSAWYPQFADDAMVSFRLDIQVPADWDVVSQGTLVREQKTTATQNVVWEETQPQDD
ncbi:MAG: signal protein PDZ, partial [Nitrosomonas sp.]|nr:signal protein PDZ [Nitrosomonas sp.]